MSNSTVNQNAFIDNENANLACIARATKDLVLLVNITLPKPIEVEYHTVAFGDFEVEIPQGQYGAGQIQVRDADTYEASTWRTDSILFSLHGLRCAGEFRFVRFNRGKPWDWLFFKIPALKALSPTRPKAA